MNFHSLSVPFALGYAKRIFSHNATKLMLSVDLYKIISSLRHLFDIYIYWKFFVRFPLKHTFHNELALNLCLSWL